MKILSVDDSKLIRKMIQNAAEVLELEFFEAENAEIALNIIKTQGEELKLILLDWHMPGMSGFELLKILKNDENLKNIPVMMVTSEVDRMSIVKAVKAGANHYLTKPFTQESLITKILESLGMGA